MIDIKMIWADILIFISFLVTKAPSEGQPSSFIKTEFGHFAQKKKNRLYTVFCTQKHSHFSSPLLTTLEGLSVAESCLKSASELHIAALLNFSKCSASKSR